MARSKNSWLPIIIVGLIVMVVAAVALVAVGVYVFFRQVSIEPTTMADAAREFRDARARFAGQKPLLVIDDRRVVKSRQDNPSQPGRGAALETMHVLTWDSEEERVIRIAIPFWLLRLKDRGTFSFSSGSATLDSEDLDLTLDDLERHGPGLIVDYEDPGGDRVLVWVQ